MARAGTFNPKREIPGAHPEGARRGRRGTVAKRHHGFSEQKKGCVATPGFLRINEKNCVAIYSPSHDFQRIIWRGM
jgi:hypothetical protein